MSRSILVLNTGSSSVKFSLFAARGAGVGTCLCSGQVEFVGGVGRFRATHGHPGTSHVATLPRRDANHASAIGFLLDWLEARFPDMRLAAAGHRVVHGGAAFKDPVLVRGRVLGALEQLVALAPLHQPPSIAGIRAVARSRGSLPQVACFDTAFHCTQPEVARRFALPERFFAEGVRRYGFHGISYESVARRLPAILGRRANGRVVVAHLGNGASLCALRRRRSVATTMGFTPLDGLMMGTRPGSLDPGVVLYLLRERGYTEPRLARLLFHECGLLGVSGISHDMRDLLASKAASAKRAVELYVYRLVREIGALSAVLGGLEALVFTGGIGEHSPVIRRRTCEALAGFGVALDGRANAAGDIHIAAKGSRVAVCVLPADEETVIARHTARLVPV